MRFRPALVSLTGFATLVAVAVSGATCKGGDPAPAATPPKSPIEPAKVQPPEPVVKAPEVTDIPGVDISLVPPSFRADFVRLMNETFCYCGCPRTLASCLSNRADCGCVKCSERMTQFILEQFRVGMSTQDVEFQLLEGFAEGFNGPNIEVDTSNHPMKGKQDARHTMIEFADFRCGHCAAAFPVVKKLVETRPDVRVFYFYFPLGDDQSPSILIAEAAEEARKQGKFWEYAEQLFLNQHNLDPAKLMELAQKVGLDKAKLKDALDKHTHRATVLSDKRLGISLGVASTPTFYVDGRPFGLDRTLDSFVMRLDMESERGQCK
ncbi:MAG: thioredoxin domain-containing protein [Deltaproteobacteria bacterium]|nr:thioredoxin domain-containing protein [Deltaproteobacteria bacterium]